MAYTVARIVLTAQRNSANGKIFTNHLSRDFYVFNTKIIKASRPLFSMSRSQNHDSLKSINSGAQLSNFHTTDTNRVLAKYDRTRYFDEFVWKAFDPDVLRIKEEIRRKLTDYKESSDPRNSNQSPMKTATDIDQAEKNDWKRESYQSHIKEGIERIAPQIKEAIMKEFYTEPETGCSKQLVEYLSKKIQANCGIPDLEKPKNFDYDLNGTEVIFKRKMGDEIIIVKADISNSLDKHNCFLSANDSPGRKGLFMTAKPHFTIEIQNGKDVLKFLCTCLKSMNKMDREEEMRTSWDSFRIVEMSLYENENTSKASYIVQGHLMDCHFYHLMMMYLADKGISPLFVYNMTNFLTYYYYKLLNLYMQEIKSMVEK